MAKTHYILVHKDNSLKHPPVVFDRPEDVASFFVGSWGTKVADNWLVFVDRPHKIKLKNPQHGPKGHYQQIIKKLKELQ